jgi:hypothetical protein
MSLGPSGPSFIMIATIYIVLFILAVVAVTYPKEFPTLMRDPESLLQVTSLELRRRWLMLKIGSQLWFERKRLAFSLWRMKDIIAAERAKQQAKEETID